MVLSIIPAFLMGGVSSYGQLLSYGFLIGIALASFSVGVAFVNGWYPPERQGFALGVYGAGNIGQSLAAYGSPVLAAAVGFKWGFWTFGVLLAMWLVIFASMARNAPNRVPAEVVCAKSRGRLNDKRSWVLSLYYFLTFGGFVAMAVYLPTLLTEVFKLTPQDAGFRTAGFVVLATALRPVGGVLADKIGGRTILKWVFPATAVFAIFLACPLMSTFTIGALGHGSIDRAGQWSRLQTCTRILSPVRGRRYRTGWRGGRTWRILPAAPARRHQTANRIVHPWLCVA